MREYLTALDGEAAAPAPRKISLSDPHSRWAAAKGGVAFFAYSTNYLIDAVPQGYRSRSSHAPFL